MYDDVASITRGVAVLRIMRAIVLSLLLIATILQTAAPSNASGLALFGIYPGPAEANPGYNIQFGYLGDLVSWQGGKANAILNMYDGLGGLPTTDITADLLRAWANSSVPMITFGTGWIPPASIAAGAADAALIAYGLELNEFLAGPDHLYGGTHAADDRRLYFRLDWESNGDWYQWSPCFVVPETGAHISNPDAFKAMWRHIHEVFTSGLFHPGLGFDSSHVAWVWNVDRNSATCPGFSDVSQLYPGDDVVDWVGIDGYNHNDGAAWESPPTVFGTMVSNIRTFTSKPMGINEVGCQTSGGSKASWITDYFSFVQDNDIRMSLWFNHDNGADHNNAVFGGSTPGDSTYPGLLATYETWSTYSAAVQASWLLTTDADNPRLLTDARFLGNF